MRKKIFKLSIYAFLICTGIFLLAVFIPKAYEVPHLQKRENTKYWNLKKGSTIAFTLIPALGVKKPYPIIYLQGGPGGFVSDRIIKTLKPLSEEGFDIYFYDQIGSGLSERLIDITEYTAERHKNDLVEIINTIGSDKVILIGQSWGAILATLYMAEHTDKVEKAIFIGPGPLLPVRKELTSIHAPDSLHLKNPVFSNSEANEKCQNIRVRAITFWAKALGKKLASDAEADDFQTFLNNELNKATVCDTSNALKAEAGGGFYVQVMTTKSFDKMKDIRPKLIDCKIPVLIMKGQCDNQPWGFVHEYFELFPNYQLKIIPDAGHSISVEQPELYLKTILDFLMQHNR